MGARILLVDDYEDALFMWALFLRMRGFDVDTARDGATAVRLALDQAPDLIVMDLGLPVIDGCEAARLIRASPRTRQVPIIATTGSTLPALLDEARAVGFVRIMIKPCDPPRLVDEIERALDARYVVGDSLNISRSSGLLERRMER